MGEQDHGGVPWNGMPPPIHGHYAPSPHPDDVLSSAPSRKQIEGELERIRKDLQGLIAAGAELLAMEPARLLEQAMVMEWVLGEIPTLVLMRGPTFEMTIGQKINRIGRHLYIGSFYCLDCGHRYSCSLHDRRPPCPACQALGKPTSAADAMPDPAVTDFMRGANAEASRYPPAEELEEEAEPVVHAVEHTRMSEDGCPHDPPLEMNWKWLKVVNESPQVDNPAAEIASARAQLTSQLDLIVKDASNKLTFLLRDTGLKHELRLTVDGEQDGVRVLIGPSYGDLAAHRDAQPTYRPDGSMQRKPGPDRLHRPWR